jgi:hypothetical protein
MDQRHPAAQGAFARRQRGGRQASCVISVR